MNNALGKACVAQKRKKSLKFLNAAYLKPPSIWLVNLGRFGLLVVKSEL